MSNENILNNIEILPINMNLEKEARKLIYEGLSERFGVIDTTLNPDLQNIVENYIKKDNIFIVGLYKGNIICTGALIKENDQTGRIVRMYVKKDFRRMGIARHIVKILENYGKHKKFVKIVLETTEDWKSAIKLYESCGYQKFDHFDGNIHLKKNLHNNYINKN